MSDSDCFCQLKFVFRELKWFFTILLSILLFSCEGNNEASSYDTYNNPPTRYVPYRQRVYRPAYRPNYQQPYSRVYQNPYELYQQNPYYPNYYDQDYYYVPPSNYRNVEPDSGFGADQKS